MLAFLVRSNFYIGLAAIAVAAVSQFRLSGELHADSWYGFLFFSTQWLYSFSQFFSSSIRQKSIHSFADALFRGFQFMLSFNGWFPALCILPFIFFLDPERLIPLIPAAILAIAYSFPFRAPGKGVVRLRELLVLKPIMIALIWAVMTELIPAIHLVSINSDLLWIQFFERAAFIFALALGSDLFDMEWDRDAGQKTLALKIGRPSMLRLIYLGFGLSAIFLIISLASGEKLFPVAHLLLFLTCPFAAITIKKMQYGLGDLIDYLVIDGLIILQGIIFLPLFIHSS